MPYEQAVASLYAIFCDEVIETTLYPNTKKKVPFP